MCVCVCAGVEKCLNIIIVCGVLCDLKPVNGELTDIRLAVIVVPILPLLSTIATVNQIGENRINDVMILQLNLNVGVFSMRKNPEMRNNKKKLSDKKSNIGRRNNKIMKRKINKKNNCKKINNHSSVTSSCRNNNLNNGNVINHRSSKSLHLLSTTSALHQ